MGRSEGNRSDVDSRQILNRLKDGIVVINSSGVIVFANKTICDLFEITEADFLGHSLCGIMGAKDDTVREEVADALRSAFHSGDCTFHMKVEVAEGWRWCELDLQRTLFGDKLCVIASLRDLGSKEGQTTAILQSEEKFAKIFSRSSNGMAVTEFETGQIVDVNQAWIESSGISRAQALGRTALELGLWPDLDARRKCVEVLRAQGRLYDYEIDFKMKGGRLPFLVSAERFEMSRRSYTLWEFRNISAWKQAQEAVRSSEEKYRVLVETAHDLIWSLDAQGRWTFVNRRGAQEIYGYEPEEMLGRPISEFKSDSSDQGAGIRDKLQMGLTMHRYESQHRTKDGRTVYLSFNGIPLFDEQGVFLGATGTARNITDRRRLEEQLRLSQKMEAVGQLAGGVAHDFNNLLSVIVGFTDLILSDMPTSSPFREELEQVLKAANRASALTRQLLAFSRRSVMEMKVLDLNLVVGDSEAMLRRIIGENIVLESHFAADVPRIKADPNQLSQVLVNLAVNARDSMPEGGKLSLRTERAVLGADSEWVSEDLPPGVYASFVVGDTGIGMSADILARIFEPFFTTKPQGKGTGLGLSVAHGIVKQSNGAIEVDSKPGLGSTFRVLLPEAPLEPGHSDSEAPSRGVGNERILLVEDEDGVRAVAERALTSQGYQVMAARDGLEALHLLESGVQKFDLLLVDMVMPGMNGQQFSKEVWNRWPETRIQFMSGYSADVLAPPGASEAQHEILQKPFTVLTLCQAVRSALDRK